MHVDAYRLGGAAELDDLDLDASLDEAVTVVEWGEGWPRGWPRTGSRSTLRAATPARDGRGPRATVSAWARAGPASASLDALALG